MAEEGYKGAEAPKAAFANCFQVSTLGGDAKTVSVKNGKSWVNFKEQLEKEFGIPIALRRLVQDEEVLQFVLTETVASLVETSKLPEDKMITIMRKVKTWLWVDAEGKNPSADYDDHLGSYGKLKKILEWLEGSHGEDTCTEEMGVGVIQVCGDEMPQEADDVLNFLRGGEEVSEHPPVSPETDGDEELGLPWNDIEELGAINDISDVWPPRRATTAYYGCVARPLSAEAVTRALVCADADTSEEDVQELASQCCFFGVVDAKGKLKQSEEMEDGSYFHNKYNPEALFFICVNPAKKTIAFCYAGTYWD